MKRYSGHEIDNACHIIGAQPHKFVNGKGKRNIGHSKAQTDFERTDRVHDKYSRSERRNFIQMANKIYVKPIVH